MASWLDSGTPNPSRRSFLSVGQARSSRDYLAESVGQISGSKKGSYTWARLRRKMRQTCCVLASVRPRTRWAAGAQPGFPAASAVMGAKMATVDRNDEETGRRLSRVPSLRVGPMAVSHRRGATMRSKAH